MAPTEGRVARPEQRWGCCRGTSRDMLTHPGPGPITEGNLWLCTAA